MMVSARPRSPAIDQPLPGVNGRHRTALHVATCNGDATAVRELLARGASVAVRDVEGFTPLHDAAFHGSLACIVELVQAGAAVDARATVFDDARPLELAVIRNRHGPVLSALLQAGADPFIPATRSIGATPEEIEQARFGVDREVLRLLDADRDGAFRTHLATHAAAHLGDGGEQAQRAAQWLAIAAEPLVRTDWELIDHVRGFGECKPDSGAWPTDFDWRDVEHHPVETLIGCMPGGRSAWASWWADEIDGVPGQWERLVTDPRIELPIICSGPRRTILEPKITHIWDGWHRTAAAIISGKPTVPAIVGRERR